MKITIRPQDYLFGRSEHCRNHGGNQLVKALVARLNAEYQTADKGSDVWDKAKKKRDKHVIKQQIIDAVKARGGRFLKRTKTATSGDRQAEQWVVVPDRKVHVRIIEEFKTIRTKMAPSSPLAVTNQPVVQMKDCSHVVSSAADDRKVRGDDSNNHDDESLIEIVLPEPHSTVEDDDVEDSSTSSNNGADETVSTWTLVSATSSTVPAFHQNYYSPTPSFVSLVEAKKHGPTTKTTDRPSMLPPNVADEDTVSLSLLGSLAGMSVSMTMQQQQQQQYQPSSDDEGMTFADQNFHPTATSDASGGAAPSSSVVSGEPMSFMSVSEASKQQQRTTASDGTTKRIVLRGTNKTFGVSSNTSLSSTTVVVAKDEAAKSSSKSSSGGFACTILPHSLRVVRLEDESTSKPSTNAVEHITEKLHWMQENGDDAELVAEHTDALAGETLKYYGSNDDDDGYYQKGRGQTTTTIRKGGVAYNYHYGNRSNIPSSRSQQRRKRRVVGTLNAETIALLLDVIKLHPQNASIQRNSCLILSNLARSRDNLGAIGGAGSVWLVGAMERAAANATTNTTTTNDEEEMLRVCSYALSNLALNDSNRIVIGECGGIEALVRAMRNHPDEEKLHRYTCNALGNLARGKKGENRAKIKSEGGVVLLVAAMKKFPKSYNLQQSCLRAFGNLAKDDVGRSAIMEANGIRQVIAALNTFTEEHHHEELQESGCHALGNLCMGMECSVAIISIGGVDCVVRAMQMYGTNEELQRYGCFALFYMTRHCYQTILQKEDEQHTDVIKSIRGVVEAAMTKFGYDSKPIRKYGKKTLENVMRNQQQQQQQIPSPRDFCM